MTDVVRDDRVVALGRHKRKRSGWQGGGVRMAGGHSGWQERRCTERHTSCGM